MPALRLFAIEFYDNSLDADRRMLGVDSPVSLVDGSIRIANDITRFLNAGSVTREAEA